MRGTKLIALAAAVAVAATVGFGSVRVAAQDVSARVNIALEDGTIMMYAGSNKGVSAGDEFETRRSGAVVGRLKVLRVKELFSYCELVEGDAREMDIAVRVKKAQIVEERTITMRKRDAGDEAAAAPAPAKESEAPAAEEPTAGTRSRSVRRDEAAKTTDETPAASAPKTDKTADAGKKTSEPAKPKEPEKAKDKGARDAGSIGPRGIAAYGLSGLALTPTANTLPGGRGGAGLVYADFSNEDYNFSDAGVSVSYGLSGDIELAAAYVSRDISTGDADISSDATLTALSFKYRLPHTKPPAFFKKEFKEVRYAVGAQMFSYDYTTTAWGVSQSYDANANRVFAVATGDYKSRFVTHFGIYAQSGDLSDDEDGFGFMGGAEYLFNRDESSLMEKMSVLLEYDHKAFYLGTAKTLTLGFKYGFKDKADVGLFLTDVGSANALMFKGTYFF
jgi:hypothetical protein